MKQTRQLTTAAVDALSREIARGVELTRRGAEIEAELRAVRAHIRDVMEDAGIERQATATGDEALLVTRVGLSWDAGKLRDVLSRQQFAELVPPTPDGSGLRALMEASNAAFADELRRCARARRSVVVDLRAAPAASEVTA